MGRARITRTLATDVSDSAHIPSHLTAEAILRDTDGEWAADESGCWWLFCKWLSHRQTAQDVHPLLLRLRQARGNAFMTSEIVLSIMDAKDPETLVSAWIAEAAIQNGQQERQPCEWEDCRRQAISGHLFCRRHCERALKRGLAIRAGDAPGEGSDTRMEELRTI